MLHKPTASLSSTAGMRQNLIAGILWLRLSKDQVVAYRSEFTHSGLAAYLPLIGC